jgi:predicted transcriptional regulator of viral defense system
VVWVALPRQAAIPQVRDLPLRFVRFSGEAYTAGVDTHVLNGVAVRITNPAKTVADCFKFRHKLGLDVAIEALREGRRERRFTMDELWKYAKVCRVANVLRPYMEAFAI